MDATNEIKAILQKNTDVKTVVNDLDNQAKEIGQKKHLVKVVNLAHTIEKLVIEGAFKKNNVYYMIIDKEWDKSAFKLVFKLKNERGYEIGNNLSDNGQLTSKLKNLYVLLDKYEEQYVNDALIYQRVPESMELKPGIQKKILNLLLNPELLNALNYAELSMELDTNPSNNQHSTQKFKI